MAAPHPVPFIVSLLLLLAGLAGCLDVPRDDGNGTDGNGTGGTDGGDGDGDGDGITDVPGDGGADPGPDEPAPARGPPPGEQRVSDPDDVDEPGEYALLERAEPHTDATWTVPSWQKGDTWMYRTEVHLRASACDPQSRTVANGTDTRMGVDTYRLLRQEIDCETGEVTRQSDFQLTQSDLMEIDEDGYIEHALVFPLTDGKRWVYARDGGGDRVTLVNATARHEANHLWDGKLVPAWHVTLDYQGDGNVSMEVWYGEDQKNLLKREVWADVNGAPTRIITTTLTDFTPAA